MVAYKDVIYNTPHHMYHTLPYHNTSCHRETHHTTPHCPIPPHTTLLHTNITFIKAKKPVGKLIVGINFLDVMEGIDQTYL